LEFTHESLKIENEDLVRAKQLERMGVKSFDAMHSIPDAKSWGFCGANPPAT